jgi:hypothetical protein
MLKSIFLGPGRFFFGQPSTEELRARRWNLKVRSQSPAIFVSLIFWLLLMAGGYLLLQKFSNVDPPPPKPRAEIKSLTPTGAQPSGTAPMVVSTASGGSLGASSPTNQTSGAVTPAADPIAPVEKALPPPEIWLVIVESIPKSARSEAERALARHKKKGLELELLDTDAYPKLKSGLWALAQGPFDSKKEAEAAALVLKPKVKSLMVRRGL